MTILTDGNLADQVDFELPFKLDVVRIDAAGPNIGITEFSARRSGPESWEVFVRVAGSTTEIRDGELQLFENGQQTSAERVEVAADESQRLVFPLDTTEPTLLEARLVPGDSDSVFD